MKNNNVLYAQSGGPSPVINSSLRGAVELCRAMPETFGTVYAGYHGIEGVLEGRAARSVGAKMSKRSLCWA